MDVAVTGTKKTITVRSPIQVQTDSVLHHAYQCITDSVYTHIPLELHISPIDSQPPAG